MLFVTKLFEECVARDLGVAGRFGCGWKIWVWLEDLGVVAVVRVWCVLSKYCIYFSN